MKRFGTSRAAYKAERVFDYSYLFFEFFRELISMQYENG